MAMSSPVKLIKTRRIEDSRGWFVETWNQARWEAQGVVADFVQDNHSLSRPVGTIRGIHFQRPPHGQGKLVRCARGRIMDYAVDLRGGSPTYGQHVAAELSADGGDQLWIPIGFGHAFVTLEPDTEVIYKVTGLYNAEAEGGLRWDCPDLAITWPLPAEGPSLSPRDELLPMLADFQSPFTYDGEQLQPL
jgi:dTDP-4-dehydrorhamnose 3,5-epimerase